MDIQLCTRKIGNDVLVYDLEVVHAAARGLPVRHRALAEFDLASMHFFSSFDDANVRSFVAHMRRVEAADPAVPIILAQDGCILDGMHRLARAELTGATSIPTVELLTDPAPFQIVRLGGA